MKFTNAFHILDADKIQRTVGIDKDGYLWIVSAQDANGIHEGPPRFTPAEAVRFGAEIITLALQAMRAREHSGYEQFPLRTAWGYGRYQDLSAVMSPKQAMAQASREENETFPCTRCGNPLRLTDNGTWTVTDKSDVTGCVHEPAIGTGDWNDNGTEN